MLSSKSKNVVELNSKSTSSSDPEKFKRKTSCVDCGKKMEFNDYFEQDHADWEVGSSSQHVRCPPCFEKFVQKEVLPNHHGRLVKKRKLKESSPDSPYHFACFKKTANAKNIVASAQRLSELLRRASTAQVWSVQATSRLAMVIGMYNRCGALQRINNASIAGNSTENPSTFGKTGCTELVSRDPLFGVACVRCNCV